MFIISFDVATKTFAYVLVKVKDTTDQVVDCLDILTGDVCDFSGNKKNTKISEIERLKLFNQFAQTTLFPLLTQYDCDKTNTLILIEYQMSSNVKSRTISTALATLFIDFNIEYIKPSLKNTIYFKDELRHSVFIEKYKSQYTANKNHATQNALYYKNTFYSDLDIPINSHTSDAFMGAYWYTKNKLK